jgi:starch-binding outer membrane protein, SusD/RagB family
MLTMLSAMKRKYKILVLIVLAMQVFTPACNDLLDENPKTVFTTDYFKTAPGLQDGLNAAYSYLRFQYGTNPALGLNVTGTDEFTFGPEPNYNSSGDNQPHKLLGTYDVTPQAGYLLITFNRTFPVINTLNGLIAAAPEVPGITELVRTESIAQARYLRAHYYYLLVSQFGAVPLDLGSGELAFNTVPYTGFKRGENAAEREELLIRNYEVMIEDLTFATENLPDRRDPLQFKLFKAVAYHLLAKVYLARSYNPVLAQPTDAQKAYEAAIQVINNQALYGVALQTDFARVFEQGNDYNSEMLFSAERIPGNYINNGYLNANADGIGDGENMANNCFTSNYEQGITNLRVVPPTPPVPPGLPPGSAYPANTGDVIEGRPQAFQRPLRKLAPTHWLTDIAFADKTNDSRYHNSFRTLWTCLNQNPTISAPNMPGGTISFAQWLANHGRLLGDTAFYLADTHAQALAMQTKYYKVFSPNEWYTNQLYPGPPAPANQILVYPSLKKFADAQRAHQNGSSGRPQPIFRLAETYLLAAEAAFKIGGATAEVVDLINTVRVRAAYRPGLAPATLTARQTAMQIVAGDVTLDFILDERARELAGEGMRWTDLALRGEITFINRVNLNPDANTKVLAKHIVRPIPQSQLDAISDPDKAKYQNPGY